MTPFAPEKHSIESASSVNKKETTSCSITSVKSNRTRRPDKAVYVPRARQTTPRSSSTNVNQNNCESTNNSATGVTISKRRSDPEEYRTTDNRLKTTESETSTNITSNKISKQVKLSNFQSNYNKEEAILVSECATNNLRNLSLVKQNTIDNSDCDTNGTRNIEMAPPKKQHQHKSVKIENVAKHTKDDDEVNREENELRKVSQEINRTSRRIIKQTFNSDVLEIGTEDSVKSKESVSRKNSNNSSASSTDMKKVDPEEDDWESMFNESGDCLDPKMMDELTAQVGKVTIEKPKTDYKVKHYVNCYKNSYLTFVLQLYQTKQALLLEEEFPHVLEVSNFPGEFKTQDLIMTFSPYKESGFDIKWVDDTHALVVFSNSKIGTELLKLPHYLFTYEIFL